MSRRKQHAHPHNRSLSLRKTLRLCPYRSLLDVGTDPKEMAKRVTCAIAVIGSGETEPLSESMLADAVAALTAGRVVLVLSDDRAQRDRAKWEILSLAGPAGGAA